MTPGELEAELAAGRLRPAYLLTGPEALLREDGRRAHRERRVRRRARGTSTSTGSTGSAARPPPWRTRCARCRCWRRAASWCCASPRRAGAARPCWSASRPCSPASRTCASACSSWWRSASTAARAGCAPSPSRRRASTARRPATCATSPPSCAARPARQGVALAPGAAEALAERVGPQLLLLRQEIAKAALFAGPGRPVTPAHVAETASDAAEEPIWSLTDAIGEGPRSRRPRAPRAHGRRAARRRRRCSAPSRATSASSRGCASGGRVAAPPFALRKLESQARRYAPARLRACLRALHDTDERLKGRGELPAELALERLVLALAASPVRRGRLGLGELVDRLRQAGHAAVDPALRHDALGGRLAELALRRRGAARPPRPRRPRRSPRAGPSRRCGCGGGRSGCGPRACAPGGLASRRTCDGPWLLGERGPRHRGKGRAGSSLQRPRRAGR